MKTAAAIAALAMVANARPQGGIANSLMSEAMERKTEARARYAAEGMIPKAGISSSSEFVPCEGGEVFTPHGTYTCRLTDFYSFTTHSDMGSNEPEGNDIWGWTDPESGEEFVAVGQLDGTAFVRIESDGTQTYLGRLPTQTVSTIWRDMKSYKNWMVIGSEAEGHGIQFFNMSILVGMTAGNRTFTADSWYDGVGSSHNVVINEESGFLYVVGSDQFGQGLYAVDIKDPLNPTFAGDFSIDGYTHDAQCIMYDGPDQDYVGKEVCAAYNEDTLTFVDVSNKNRMRIISRVTYKGYSYTHQGWWSTDRRSLFVDDEIDELDLSVPNNMPFTRTIIFNTEDLDNPFYVGDFISSQEAIDHNQYIVPVGAAGRTVDYIAQANYTAGLRILQLRRGGFALRERGFFDVHPENTGAEFMGAWSVYPYFKSGYVAVNSIERGLFVVAPRQFAPAGAISDGGIPVADQEVLEDDDEPIVITDSNTGEEMTFNTEEDLQAYLDELRDQQ